MSNDFISQVEKLDGTSGVVKYVVSREPIFDKAKLQVSLPKLFNGSVQEALAYVKSKTKQLRKLDGHTYELRQHIVDTPNDLRSVMELKQKIEELPNFVSWDYESHKLSL